VQLPDYVVTMPNMYARGILFGKMVLELGDTCVVKNMQTGILCDIEFKTKVCSRFDCNFRLILISMIFLSFFSSSGVFLRHI
jgi:Oxysterol-binding protein